jgi:hypothetical protein
MVVYRKGGNKMKDCEMFEVGERYAGWFGVYEVIKKTAKFVTFQHIQHPGNWNEKREDKYTAKIRDWGTREVCCFGAETIEATHKA